jgi:hypothetical protein
MPCRTPVAGQSGHSRTSDATLRFGGSLIAADRGLARQVARHRVEGRTRRQRGAGVVEVENVGHTGLSDLSNGTSMVICSIRLGRMFMTVL